MMPAAGVRPSRQTLANGRYPAANSTSRLGACTYTQLTFCYTECSSCLLWFAVQCLLYLVFCCTNSTLCLTVMMSNSMFVTWSLDMCKCGVLRLHTVLLTIPNVPEVQTRGHYSKDVGLRIGKEHRICRAEEDKHNQAYTA